MANVQFNSELPQDGGKGNLKATQRTSIQTNMTIFDVQKNGSEPQKIMAEVYDTDNNKVYDKKEAEYMNNVRFADDPENKEFRIHDNNVGTSVTIKYGDRKDFLKNKDLANLSRAFEGAKITVDLRTKTILIEDGVGSILGSNPTFKSLSSDFNITIRNTLIDCIHLPESYHGTLTLEGSVESSNILRKKTDAWISKDATINVKGNDVRVAITRREE